MKSAKRSSPGYDGRILCLNRYDEPLTNEKLSLEMEKVYSYCFPEVSESKQLKKPFEKGLKKLRKIIRRVSSRQIDSKKMKILLHCSIRHLIHFQNLLYFKESFCNWNVRRQYQTAVSCYLNLLRLSVPKNEKEIVTAVIDVIREEGLFEYQDLSLDLLNALVSIEALGYAVINGLLSEVEDPKKSTETARSVIRTLYEFMDTYDWPETDADTEVLKRLLSIYRLSIGQAKPPYKHLSKGLKVCLQHTLAHLANSQILIAIRHMCSWSVDYTIGDEDVLDFGSSLEYAAFRHATELFKDTLTPEIFSLIMRMIASPSRLVSLLGNRVMQHLIDRGDNKTRFETPQIFFEDTQYDLNVNRYHREDKIFLKNNRAELHDGLIRGILNHCSTRLNLESSYCTICIVAVEVPCGFTAAALVCLAMNLQDRTMERDDLRKEVTFHIHACVVAVLSLLCWIHRAKVFYQYVNKIMMERARWAPHLNPPIQSHYYFATHHVLWDKPELFFVDWEARYGLWKCFRLLES